MTRFVVAAAALLLALPAFSSVAAVGVSMPEPELDDTAVLKHVFPTVEKRLAGSGNQATPNMQYHGGAVHHAPRVYLVFWGWGGPENALVSDPEGEAAILQAFFAGVGGSAWAGVQAQFADGSGPIGNPGGQLAGVWWDDDLVNGFPVQPDLFIVDEALRAAEHFGYDPDGNYFIATPHLRNDAEFGLVYCAWHSWVDDDQGRTVAFTDLPYMPDGGAGCPGDFVNPGSTTDAITIVAGHEYAEAVTDPHGDGWFDTNGAGENGDKCAWNSGPGARSQNIVLPTGTFAVQSLWSNVDQACAVSYSGAPGAALDPSSGDPPTPVVPIAYHEEGSVLVPTAQPLVVGLNTQWSALGQGTSTWRLDDSAIRALGGQTYWLNTTDAAGADDFDVYYYDADDNVLDSGTNLGDEAGAVPRGVDHAIVMLSLGAPGSFTFETG